MPKVLQKLWLDPLGYLLDSKHRFLRTIGERAFASQTTRYEALGAANGSRKITVIMTAYNTGALVKKAIQSLLFQTHQNFELMVIDDASTDDTLGILKDIAATDSRIKIYHSPVNHGTYWSKNWCLRQASNEFVAFHDSDDVSAPKRLQTQLGAILANPKRVSVNCRWERIDDDGELLTINGKRSQASMITLMCRREAVLEKIGYFDSVRIAADMEYVVRIKHAFCVRSHGSMRQVLYTALLRDGSLTRSEKGGFNWLRNGTSVTREMVPGDRADYHAAAKAWLGDAGRRRGSAVYIDFPLPERPFEAAEAICKGCADMDVNQVIKVVGT